MFDLSSHCALVTGASGGIGEAIAKKLHSRGATVALSGTRRTALEEIAQQLGERAFILPCDLSNPQDVEALIPAAEDLMGKIDILVNNAGITRDNLALRLKDEDWQLSFQAL
jgi:3-oxoacyl-[acyl-carrier protein] reductase